MAIDITYAEFLKIAKDETYRKDHLPEQLKNSEYCECGFFDIIQGKWKNHILFTMCIKGTIRFGELKKSIPNITSAALTNALRELEESNLITRTHYAEIPPRVEYSLTPMAKDLMPVYYEMFKWGLKYFRI